jgi:hypothetical protein
MTITSLLSRWEYQGDAATVDFAYSNKIFANTELNVYVDGVLKTLTTDYTVSGVGVVTGGNVTFVTAPALAAVVVIIRAVLNTQVTDYPIGGAFPSTTVENDLDRRTIVAQQLEERLDRTIATPSSEMQLDMTLPVAATRASKYLGFDSNGQPVELTAPSGTTTTSTYGAAFHLAADFEAAQTLLNINTSVTTAGTLTAYTYTSGETITAYEDGPLFGVDFHVTCGASPTINVDGFGAKALKWPNGTALAAGDVVTGQKAILTYDGTDMIVLSASGNVAAKNIGADAGEIAVNEQDWTAIASAATVNIGAAATERVNITGTTTITAFDTVTAGLSREVRFDGALTLTHNGTSLILPSAVNITTAAGDVAKFVSEGSGNWRCLNYSPASGYSVAGGKVLQVVKTQTGAVATGTTTVPIDDTIPQNTEGDEYMTLAVTPKSASSRLRVDVVWHGGHSTAGATVIAVSLFRDSAADALAVGADRAEVASSVQNIAFSHDMASPGTSATTFKVRAGGEDAGTTTFNGQGGARIYGGVLASSIIITEYVP